MRRLIPLVIYLQNNWVLISLSGKRRLLENEQTKLQTVLSCDN